MASTWSAPRNELSCPVCRDVFKDPVLLPCSHTLCNTCVLKWWATKRSRECPVCRTVSSTFTPPRNLVLKNLCEAFLLEVEAGLLCSQHTEKLKLFCLNHGTPVCVVCRDSQQHTNHRFIPVDEAAKAGKNVLLEKLKPLKEKVKLFTEMKVQWEKTDEEIKNQAQDTEEKIKEEFSVLQAFLQMEEKTRIEALKKEETFKRKIMKDRIDALSRELNTMESTVKTIEGGLSEEDTAFLLKAGALTKEFHRPLPDDPHQVTGPYIDVASHLGNMSFNAWLKMKEIVSYTSVILNPNTAHQELCLSDGLTSVTCGPKQPRCVLLHSQPERMDQHRSVLGCEGFISGSHIWEVEVGDNQVWALGVMAQDAQRKGNILSGLWIVRFCKGKFTTFSPSHPVSDLQLKDRPRRVRVHLEWKKGKLSFSDLDTDAVIHTFTHPFTERLFPYINTWDDLPLKILPLQLYVAKG